MNVESRELKIMCIKSRIELLKSRAGCENGNIIKKLQRKLRQYEAERS